MFSKLNIQCYYTGPGIVNYFLRDYTCSFLYIFCRYSRLRYFSNDSLHISYRYSCT